MIYETCSLGNQQKSPKPLNDVHDWGQVNTTGNLRKRLSGSFWMAGRFRGICSVFGVVDLAVFDMISYFRMSVGGNYGKLWEICRKHKKEIPIN